MSIDTKTVNDDEPRQMTSLKTVNVQLSDILNNPKVEIKNKPSTTNETSCNKTLSAKMNCAAPGRHDKANETDSLKCCSNCDNQLSKDKSKKTVERDNDVSNTNEPIRIMCKIPLHKLAMCLINNKEQSTNDNTNRVSPLLLDPIVTGNSTPTDLDCNEEFHPSSSKDATRVDIPPIPKLHLVRCREAGEDEWHANIVDELQEQQEPETTQKTIGKRKRKCSCELQIAQKKKLNRTKPGNKLQDKRCETFDAKGRNSSRRPSTASDTDSDNTKDMLYEKQRTNEPLVATNIVVSNNTSNLQCNDNDKLLGSGESSCSSSMSPITISSESESSCASPIHTYVQNSPRAHTTETSSSGKTQDSNTNPSKIINFKKRIVNLYNPDTELDVNITPISSITSITDNDLLTKSETRMLYYNNLPTNELESSFGRLCSDIFDSQFNELCKQESELMMLSFDLTDNDSLLETIDQFNLLFLKYYESLRLWSTIDDEDRHIFLVAWFVKVYTESKLALSRTVTEVKKHLCSLIYKNIQNDQLITNFLCMNDTKFVEHCTLVLTLLLKLKTFVDSNHSSLNNTFQSAIPEPFVSQSNLPAEQIFFRSNNPINIVNSPTSRKKTRTNCQRQKIVPQRHIHCPTPLYIPNHLPPLSHILNECVPSVDPPRYTTEVHPSLRPINVNYDTKHHNSSRNHIPIQHFFSSHSNPSPEFRSHSVLQNNYHGLS